VERGSFAGRALIISPSAPSRAPFSTETGQPDIMRLLGRLRSPRDEPRGCDLTRYIAVAAYQGFRLDYLIDAIPTPFSL
jgi:hypothetical protein